jgi:1-acyl-sn-glycerol-3-phosphate acyltransferase
MCRSFLLTLRVQVDVQNPEKIVQHQGFLFPNHVSFIDPLALMALVPVRFLGKAEIRSWPLLGWIASAIDTVWVARGSKESRSQARSALLDVPRTPPIALFPEGGIHPTGLLLNPFRWGAFEIAINSQVPYLTCAMIYEQRDLVFWGDESLMTVVWRVASRRGGPIALKLIPLHLVDPDPADDAKLLAAEAHGGILSILLAHHGGENVVEAGI